MGTDNLFHKRKEKSEKDLARRSTLRDGYARILIVCEGRKTEPNYFLGLKHSLRLGTANVDITGDSDPNPTRVVAFAKKRYHEEKKNELPFDYVYCVFDKDRHTDYQEALSQIKNAKPEGVFHAITSVPCFEYYLLLHYIYSAKPYTSAEVLSTLKRHYENYQKNDEKIFSTVQSRLETAKTRAEKSLVDANQNNTDNPSTNAHILVEFMQNIR